MLLMILPFIMVEPGILYCLAASPTLIMSTMFVVLYLVDQVHDLAEQLYLVSQISLCTTGLLVNMLSMTAVGAVYGVFIAHLLVALCIDQYYVFKERGFALFKK